LKSDFTVIFDLDGTLLDTLEDLADAINYALRELGHAEKSDAEVLAAIGNGIRNAIIKVLPGEPDGAEIERAAGLFRKRYKECYLSKTKPYPGVMDMLAILRGKGFKIAIISNKSDAFTAGLAEKHFGALIDAAAGERPGVPLKPDPRAVLDVLARAGGVPGRAVYVGDSEVDVAAARNAGLPCVVAGWGFRSRDVLLAAGAPPEMIAADAPAATALILSCEEAARAAIHRLPGFE